MLEQWETLPNALINLGWKKPNGCGKKALITNQVLFYSDRKKIPLGQGITEDLLQSLLMGAPRMTCSQTKHYSDDKIAYGASSREQLQINEKGPKKSWKWLK